MSSRSMMLQRLEDISTYTSKRLDSLEIIIKRLETKNYIIDKEFLTLKYEIKDILKQTDQLMKIQKKSGIFYFLKQNWWKLGGFILAFSTILGAIGEYLYRLPPPK